MIERGKSAVDPAGNIYQDRNEKDVNGDLKIGKERKIPDPPKKIPVDTGEQVDQQDEIIKRDRGK